MPGSGLPRPVNGHPRFQNTPPPSSCLTLDTNTAGQDRLTGRGLRVERRQVNDWRGERAMRSSQVCRGSL